MAPIPTIKKFSRSKVIDNIPEEIKEPIITSSKPTNKKSKSKKVVNIVEEPVIEEYQVDSPEPEPEPIINYDFEPEDNDFLNDMNNINYKDDVKEDKKEIKKNTFDSESFIKQLAN